MQETLKSLSSTEKLLLLFVLLSALFGCNRSAEKDPALEMPEISPQEDIGLEERDLDEEDLVEEDLEEEVSLDVPNDQPPERDTHWGMDEDGVCQPPHICVDPIGWPKLACDDFEPLAPLVMESYESGPLPAELGEVPRIVWENDNLGDGIEGLHGRPDFDSSQMAYGNLTVGEERRPVLVATIDELAGGYGVRTHGIVALDPQSGERLAIKEVSPRDNYEVRALMLSSSLDRYFLTLSSNIYRADMVMAGNFSEESREDYTLEIGRCSSLLRAALSKDGRLWLGSTCCGTHSFDPSTGHFRGSIITREDLGTPCNPSIVLKPIYNGPELLLQGYQGEFRSLEGCEILDTVNMDDSYAHLGEIIVERGPNGGLRDPQSYRKLNSNGCRIFGLTESGHVYCAGDWYSYQIPITLYRMDGGQEKHFVLEAEGLKQVGVATAVNGAGDILALVVVGDSEDEEEVRRRLRLYLVDLNRMTEEGYEPTMVPLGSESLTRVGLSTPILTPSGMLILSLSGRYVGVQTDIPGLARTPYPGWDNFNKAGGNERVGYVDIGE